MVIQCQDDGLSIQCGDNSAKNNVCEYVHR